VKLNSGNVCINNSISYNETKNIVLNDLKTEALRRAGVNEFISEFSSLNTLEKDNQFKEIFYSNFLSSISGTISKTEILNEVKGYNDELDCFYLNLEIKARVKKYKTKIDASFKAKVEGIEQSYNSGDNMTFKISPYKSSYLKIFYLGEEEASILFPYSNNQNTIIKEGESKTFNEFQTFTDKKREIGRLIIVITKQFYPFEFASKDENGFYTKTNTDDIMSWILAIEPEQRKEYFYEINVFK
jgi:hypothetical protein